MFRPNFSPLLRSLALVLGIMLHGNGLFPALAQTGGIGKLASLHLMQAQTNKDGSFWAVLEIRLDKNAKTYWRTAGEAGLPPRFDWTGSDNLADLLISWPAPLRFDEGGGQSIGYLHSVLLPVLIKPRDPDKPVLLDLTADYGICEKLCIPQHERLKFVFDKNKPVLPTAQAALQRAMQQVPRKQALGTGDHPSVERVISEGEILRIDTRTDTGMAIKDLFVEGPEGWVFAAPLPLTPPQGEKQGFLVNVLERPQRGDTLANLTLSVTLVTTTQASETVLTLDKQGRAP